MKTATDLKVHVLLRFSKKTGKIDTTMTGLGHAMMELWALNNTTKTKCTFIVERDTGNVVFAAQGTGDFPKVKKNAGNIEDFGIPLSAIQELIDDRFD